jgi:hypothetical protein
MKKSQVFIVCLSFLAGYIAATFLNRTSFAQQPAPHPATQEAAVRRYQLTIPNGDAFSGVVILTDTATGHCWIHPNLAGSPWQDWGSPAERK